jgi:hypothetical protein
MELLLRFEQTGLSRLIRESPSVWGYPTILFLHTVGMAVLVGLNAGIDLRVLGFAPALPLAPMAKTFPLMWAGFGINAVSGTLLLIAEATKLATPIFYVKMAFVALGLINLRLLDTRVFRNPLVGTTPLAMNAKLLAATSLIFWVGAIASGRLLSYIGTF